jgi:hypothetical protein
MQVREQELFHQRESLKFEYLGKVHAIKAREGATKEMVYPNQIECATEIIHELFTNNKVVVTLVALPQVGKTGTFLEVAYKACTHPDDDCIIDPRNIFIITGMSDRDWQKQTEMDMLEAFRRRVYHRGKLNTKSLEDGFYTNLSNARNALIILDECHIAVEKTHMISDTLKRLGLLDMNVLREKNIKLLEVSATPGATLRDTQSWGPINHSVVILNESPSYVGFKDFIRENRLHSSFDLTAEAGLNSLVEFVKHTFPAPRWHILRLPTKSRLNATFEDRFNQICAREGWRLQHHSALERVGEIDYHMGIQPKHHSFLLIKEFWRAGKRLNDSYLGIVHEPTTKSQDTNVTAQGLIGRLCGNDKQKGPAAPHMFCDTERIYEYLEWIKAKGDFTAIRSYRSRNLTIRNGRVTSSNDTFAHSSNVEGVDIAPVIHQKGSTPIIIFDITDEEKSMFKDQNSRLTILRKYNEEAYMKYKSYENHGWNVKPSNYEKWAVNSMCKKDAYSSETNIRAEDKAKNVLMIYLHGNKMIISAWNGEQTTTA